jgi:Leucine-rich repeat (LRR) protein
LSTALLHLKKEKKTAALAVTSADLLFAFANFRYLVVIDDIKIEHMEHWDHIRKIFKGKGKIIVTTAVQSVANRCSSSGENNGVKNFGYVYNMRAFGKEDSRLIALQGRCTTEILENSANLLKKCDGLPLALASVARQLDSEDEPTGQFCSKLCSDLCSYLHREDDEEPNFARLRGVLMDNYTSLSNYTVRTCLLYLSIFPANRPIRRNVIIRRWMAEGYARSDTLDGEKIADGNFRTFLDRNIIHAGPSQNATAKKCKTPGIMHEFMLHKSMSKKFIMPFGANKQKKVRHLFIHNNNDTDSRMTLKTDLSCVRSLTVLGNAGVAISDFRKYKLIRVLDLEECTDVNDGHLMDICKLYNLRYLSLGHSISTVPKEIGQLKLLETLVLSKTRENVLPIEAIGLPCLIHLVGKFKLQDPVNRQQLPTEPKMKMLTGFIADGSEGFLQLIEHMKELNKIKIWCKSVDVEADQFPAQRIAQMNNGLTDAIQKYIEAPIKMGDCRALSIDFQALPEGYLHALGDLCNHSVQTGKMYYLSSLKLYGNTSSLPEFVRLFRNLSELCLSTNLTQEFFSALGEMTCLLYLKLIADRFDSFTIQAEKFKSLRRMCFEFNRTNPALLTISCGALPELTSLQLICEHLVDLCVIELRWINQLKEIVLHPDVSEQTINKWETAAMDHPNRPNVFPHRKSDDPRNEPAPDQTSSRLPAVATEALGRSSMSSGHMNSTSDKSGFPVRVKRSRRPRLPSFLARRRSTYENSKNFGKY